MSRPTDCTPVLTERVCRILRRGHYRSVAARACGMSTETFRRWMSEDREPFRAFRAAVLDAEKEAERRLFARVLKATKSDPKLALEVLARKFPTRYGRRDHVQHDAKLHLEGLTTEQARELLQKARDEADKRLRGDE